MFLQRKAGIIDLINAAATKVSNVNISTTRLNLFKKLKGKKNYYK